MTLTGIKNRLLRVSLTNKYRYNCINQNIKYILYLYDLCYYLNTQTLYLSLCLNTDQVIKTYKAWRLGSTYPSIGNRFRRVVSFTHRPLWHWRRALFSFSIGRPTKPLLLIRNTSQKRETQPGIPTRFHGDLYSLELCHEKWIIREVHNVLRMWWNYVCFDSFPRNYLLTNLPFDAESETTNIVNPEATFRNISNKNLTSINLTLAGPCLIIQFK